MIAGGSRQPSPALILLVTGIPGSGKSTFLDYLKQRGWRVLRGDDRQHWAQGAQDAWSAALGGDDTPMQSIAAAESVGLAIEWGFPAGHLDTIESWLARGYDIWFFDGDHVAAFAAWRAAHPICPEALFHQQLSGLTAIGPEISRVLAGRRIITVSSGPTHMPPEEILRAIGRS